MSGMFSFIIDTLGSLFIGLVLMRFLMQLVRANYYNPISKSIVIATNPLLIPLRKIIPGLFGIDLAAILLVFVLEVILRIVILSLTEFHWTTYSLVVLSLIEIVKLWIQIYFIGIILLVIASWIAPGNYNPAIELMNDVLKPVLSPFRKLIPPIGVIDISSMVFFFVLQIIYNFLLPSIASMLLGLSF